MKYLYFMVDQLYLKEFIEEIHSNFKTEMKFLKFKFFLLFIYTDIYKKM